VNQAIINNEKERVRLYMERRRRAKGIPPRKPGRTKEEKKIVARETVRRLYGKFGSREEYNTYRLANSNPVSYYQRKGKYKTAEYAANLKRRIESDPEYREQVRVQRNKYNINRMKVKRKTDLIWKLHKSISESIRRACIRGYTVKSKRTPEYLGCSVEKLKTHIESQFTPLMNWNNRGAYWHIDHIIPVQFFIVNGLKPQLCWHYTNLQPLEASINSSIKSDKIITSMIQKIIAHPDTPGELCDVALSLLSY